MQLALLPAQKISGGVWHSVSICADSTVMAWGGNNYGQLGNGNNTLSTYPVSVNSLSGIISVSCGYAHTLALRRDGTVWAWGANNFGQLGDSTTTNRSIPVQVIGLSGIVEIAAGNSSSLALRNDGTLFAWGNNSMGELGDSTIIERNTPIQVHGSVNVGFLTGIVAIACGASHSLAVKNDGTVWDWGNNAFGQLGDSTTVERHTPVKVKGLNGIVEVTAGNRHSVALRNDSTVFAWGSNWIGTCGDGTTVTVRNTPVQVHGVGNSGFLTGITSIASSQSAEHTLALRSDSIVLAWGANGFGELGNTAIATESNLPVQVDTLTRIISIATGAYHSLAIKRDNSEWAWGDNADGELGNGSYVDSTLPTQVMGLCSVILAQNEIGTKTNISIFPNPIVETGKIMIDFPQTGSQYRLEIYDCSGMTVREVVLNDNQFIIEKMDFSQGFYLFRITDGNGAFVGLGKFIVL